MAFSDLELLAMQIDALFTHDLAGRVCLVNEPDGGPAPRVFLGRTRLGNMWRLRHDLPATLTHELERLLRNEPVVDDLRLPPASLTALRELLARHGPADDVWDGPAYCFPETLPVPLDIVEADPSAPDLIRPFASHDGERLAAEMRARWPCVVRLEARVPAAICLSARLTEHAAEAGVETLPDHRGRGHAVAVVTGWATMIRESGRVPLYSTSWDNLASQGVARRLGLRLYATDHSIE